MLALFARFARRRVTPTELSRCARARAQLMVHGLPFAYDTPALVDLFGRCGTILNAHVFKDNLGRGKGYGLVCFDNPQVREGVCPRWFCFWGGGVGAGALARRERTLNAVRCLPLCPPALRLGSRPSRPSASSTGSSCRAARSTWGWTPSCSEPLPFLRPWWKERSTVTRRRVVVARVCCRSGDPAKGSGRA